jgi:GTP-binding nuclear protein Ran
MSLTDEKSSPSNSWPTFKVCLIGDKKVGKTTFMKKRINGKFENNYVPTIGTKVTPLKFNTNRGEISLSVWDCAGDPEKAGIEDGNWIRSNGIFLMFDTTKLATFETAKRRLAEVNFLLGHSNPAIVLCGNKIDLARREVKTNEINPWVSEQKLDYYDISAKSNYNHEKPWLNLLRKLTNDSSLQFT